MQNPTTTASYAALIAEHNAQSKSANRNTAVRSSHSRAMSAEAVSRMARLVVGAVLAGLVVSLIVFI